MKRHDNQRGWFAYEVYKHMKKNKDIWLVVGDLGYGMWDSIRGDFPDRYINTGAAEQAMMGIGVGLALEGKIPIVYSITPFLLYRPFETIRNYVDNEKVPVIMVGAGRDRDYSHNGFSHWAEDDKRILSQLENIYPNSYWPTTKEEIPELVKKVINKPRPTYINLRRE